MKNFNMVTNPKVAMRNVLIHLKTPFYHLRLQKVPPQFRHQEIPYFSQWESRELNRLILTGSIKAEDDPKWRSSGAVSKAEYAVWSWSGCGMACLKMVLAHRNHTDVPLVALGKKCVEYDGYDLPLETSPRLKYVPFVRFLRQEFGITAKVESVMPPMQIVSELAKGHYVMSSVSPLIRNPKSQPQTKGGHVVLMVGYNLGKREFYLHNPSGDSHDSQAFAAISFADFRKFFSNRGIIISVR